ncbi:B12-binding domain-containing radical SAM protein, partial [archaeon]|nr:B12-binding domain-containing radical SAM protein [archaeon]
VGEGEETFYELIKAIDENKDLEEVNGIVFRKNNEIIKTKPRELIKNLDEIPFPARDLLDLKLYESSVTKKVSHENATYLFTSRGCPFDCVYCNAKSMWRRLTRFRSIQNVVDEIEECINKYNLKEFNIGDELFTLKEDRVIEICDEIIKRNLEISWVCMSRVDTISSNMVKKMKEAGCKLITFGFESGSKEILKNIRKMTDIDKAEEAVNIVKKEGIGVYGNFMIGNPGETEETFNETLNFSRKLDLDKASFFITVPFPGTDLYNMLKENGHLDKNLEWSRFSPVSNKYPLLRTDALNGDDLLKLQKKAFKNFYLRPKFVINQLKKLKSKDDIKDLITGIKLFLKIEK